jgi:hypothetical protein
MLDEAVSVLRRRLVIHVDVAFRELESSSTHQIILII